MTFLNALFLIALPLVAIPVLLHFVRRRDKQVVPWGAMRFLQQAQTESRRMKLPESLLLMLLRCAMVAGLIFALARPLINWGSASGGDRELIVIVDDSLSTARRIDGQPVFESIKSAAQEVVQQSKDASNFRILLAAAGGLWIGEGADDQSNMTAGSASGQAALAKLAESKPTAAEADLFACTQLALALGVNSSSAGGVGAKQVVIVTDGTNPGWQTAGERQLEALKIAIQDRGMVAHIQVLEVDAKPDDSYANLSIMRLKPLQERVGVDEKIQLAGQVTNTGNVASRPCEVAWHVGSKNDNGRPAGTSIVPALDPGQSSEISFSTRIKKPGAVAIRAKLKSKFQDRRTDKDDDDLPLDSVAKAIVEVIREVPILIIDNTLASSSASSDRLPQEIVLLASALGYDGEKPNSDYHSVFAPKLMTADEALTEDLSPWHAIIVRGADNQSAGLADRLLPEVQRGCGVWITLDAETNPDDFNDNWYQDGAGICPLPLVDTDQSSQQPADPLDDEVTSEDLRIHPPSTLHPATRTLGDLQRVDLDEVTIQQHASFEPLLLGDEVSVLLRSNRGQPLAIENAIGKGRVIVQAFPLSLDATTWPVTSSFVVLVHDWLDYLTSPSAVTLNLNSGNPITWRYSDVGSKPAWLTLPDGTEIDLSESPDSYGIENSSGTFRFFANQLPGTYTLQTSALVENPRTIPFHVARPPDESKAQMLAEPQRTLLADVGGIQWHSSAAQLVQNADDFESESTNASRAQGSTAGGQGQPIWQVLITAMIGMILIELLLAGRIGSRRGKRATATSQPLSRVQHSSVKPTPKEPTPKGSTPKGSGTNVWRSGSRAKTLFSSPKN